MVDAARIEPAPTDGPPQHGSAAPHDGTARAAVPVAGEPVSIEAAGWTLAGTLFDGNGPLVLVSGAAAVPHRFYARFAAWLAARGATVLLYDYRGVAASAGPRERWRELGMADWALKDMPAAVGWLRERFPNRPLLGVGHSYGGQAIGLNGGRLPFERYATVATMSGYWRGLGSPWSVWAQTQILGRVLSHLLKRVPGRFGLGETLPGPIFLDWARWIARPDWFFSDPEVPEAARFGDVRLPYLAVGLCDDPLGTPRAVHDLMTRFTDADLREVWIDPADGERIGHLDFFRQRNARHWPVVADFLLDGDWGRAQPLSTELATRGAR